MTKLEWCRSNAPEALRNLSDDEVLELMESSFQQFGKDFVDEDDESYESVEYVKNDTNDYLDYMVQELVREFGNKLAFKGGYMLTKLLSNTARQTTDIDFSILSDEIYSSIRTKLQCICEHFVTEGVIDRFEIKDTIGPYMSGGCDLYKDNQKILGVDVGWHDITYGTIIRSLDVCDLNSFEVERMLADKITAILSRKRFRRPKDIYDLFCISECLEFDAAKVSDYILKRTDGIGADWQNFPFSADVLHEYEKAYNKLRLQSIYKNVQLRRPDFSLVYDRFCNIAFKVRNPDNATMWSIDGHYFK